MDDYHSQRELDCGARTAQVCARSIAYINSQQTIAIINSFLFFESQLVIIMNRACSFIVNIRFVRVQVSTNDAVFEQ
jgi:hypothetical protein